MLLSRHEYKKSFNIYFTPYYIWFLPSGLGPVKGYSAVCAGARCSPVSVVILLAVSLFSADVTAPLSSPHPEPDLGSQIKPGENQNIEATK